MIDRASWLMSLGLLDRLGMLAEWQRYAHLARPALARYGSVIPPVGFDRRARGRFERGGLCSFVVGHAPYRYRRFVYGPDDDVEDVGTSVYIDGFNLYYGALKGTPYRWLDLGKLCDQMLHSHKVTKIRYFTALVKPRADKPTSPIEQQTYLRAIGTDIRVSVHFGQYLVHRKRAPLAKPPHSTVEILHTEEKGSDVNIATYLLLDAAKQRMNEAVLVTNDSDLVEAIRVVRKEFEIPVGALNPHKTPSHAIVQSAAWVRPIREGVLRASQFPETVQDNGKTIRRPTGWDKWSGNGSGSFLPPDRRK